MGKIGIGLNLEAVRTSHKSFEQGIAFAAELGYEYVEPMVHWGRELLSEARYLHSVSMLDDPFRGREARSQTFGVFVAQPTVETGDRRRIPKASRALRLRMRRADYQHARRAQAALDDRRGGLRSYQVLDQRGGEGLRAARNQNRPRNAPNLLP